jgi:transposase
VTRRARPIGASRGGRTSKIHLATDGLGRPIALHLTPGITAGIRAAPAVLAAVAPARPGRAPTAVTAPAGGRRRRR